MLRMSSQHTQPTAQTQRDTHQPVPALVSLQALPQQRPQLSRHKQPLLLPDALNLPRLPVETLAMICRQVKATAVLVGPR
jgi:hypothetical protein